MTTPRHDGRTRATLAGAAVAVMTLAGCVQQIDDDPAAAPVSEEAPQYSTEQVEDTLAEAQVDGEPLSDVGLLTDREDAETAAEGLLMLRTVMEVAPTDPQECEDTLRSSVIGGMLHDVASDSVEGTTGEGAIVTAFAMGSNAEADQKVERLIDGFRGCEQMSLDLGGQETEIRSVTEPIEIDGAGAAFAQEHQVGSQDEGVVTPSAMMSVDNVVIVVRGTEPVDYGEILEQIAPSFVDGPAESGS